MSLSTEKKNRIRCMYFTYVMFYLLYRQQWNSTPVHLNIFFCCERAIYYVAIATVIFSHVKITCYFHVWRYHVFARKFTWYFIGVYIIKCFPLITFKQSRRSLWRIKTYTYFVVNQSGVKTKPAAGSKRGKREWQAAIGICLTSDWSR